MKNYIKTIAVVFSLIMMSCVQEEHKKTITFYVDMNGIENVQTVGIRGDFLSNRWKETVLMTDENDDGIYEFTLKIETAIYGIEFKFVKNNSEFELQGKNNREIVFEYKPETIEYRTKFDDTKGIKITRD